MSNEPELSTQERHAMNIQCIDDMLECKLDDYAGALEGYDAEFSLRDYLLFQTWKEMQEMKAGLNSIAIAISNIRQERRQ